jgi:hypothetical protein
MIHISLQKAGCEKWHTSHFTQQVFWKEKFHLAKFASLHCTGGLCYKKVAKTLLCKMTHVSFYTMCLLQRKV